MATLSLQRVFKLLAQTHLTKQEGKMYDVL